MAHENVVTWCMKFSPLPMSAVLNCQSIFLSSPQRKQTRVVSFQLFDEKSWKVGHSWPKIKHFRNVAFQVAVGVSLSGVV